MDPIKISTKILLGKPVDHDDKNDHCITFKLVYL